MNETRRLAKYLGKDLSDEQLKSLIEFCKLDNLKKNPAFDMKLTNKEGQKLDPLFFRKGEIGDWKNYLTEEMSKKIDDLVATHLTYRKPFKFEPSV
jgi:hypothetical protein